MAFKTKFSYSTQYTKLQSSQIYNIDKNKYEIKSKHTKGDLINMYRDLRKLYFKFRGQ